MIAGLLLAASLVDVRVDVTPAHRVNAIRPLRAIGVGIDSDPPGEVRALYAPAKTRAMLAAGLGNLTLRLYTELSIEDWHWNPAGTFSDAAHARGYWTSDARPREREIVDSYGYRLPRRGSTRDQGDDAGYSRLDDGDPATIWKSDPYLATPFTHDPDAAHAQWIAIDLGVPRAVDAIKIAWANPYATHYDVEYWTGGDAILAQGSGAWHRFALGAARDGRGGVQVRTLGAAHVARFFRLRMVASSHTCVTPDSHDPRDCAGYAIAELGLGRLDARGRFHDLIVHSRCGGDPSDTRRCRRHQTVVFASSSDPWHRAADRVREDQDQPGLDVVSRNPIVRGLPVMYPVPMLYSTPANAVAEVAYLRARGYPIAYVEMGEEPDGQYATPEDYGTLYVQFARALHAYDPTLRLGGPVFQGVNADVAVWRDAAGDASWLHRFVRYLRAHGALDELAFMSFEHYPFAGCDQGAVLQRDLLSEPSFVRRIVSIWRRDGLPSGLPLFITEGNFASDGGPVPQQLAGGLWWADYIASALSAGVSRIYHYQYEAEPLGKSRACGLYGNYGMFVTDGHYRIRARAAQFWAARLLTQRWLAPGDASQRVYAATTSLGDVRPALTAYAAERPDGALSLLLVNKGRTARRIRATFVRGAARFSFGGTVRVTTWGAANYRWLGRSAVERPAPNTGLHERTQDADSNGTYVVPPASIAVIRGRIVPANP